MRSLTVSTGLALLLTTAVTAAAQAPAEARVNFADFVGREVRITEANGAARTGMLTAFEKGELRLRVQTGEVAIAAAGVARLDRRGDSVKNGILIGMLWPVIAFAGGAGQGYNNGGQAVYGFFTALASCGAIGAGIDGLHKGWTNVYRSDRQRSTLAIVPAPRGVRVAYVRRF
jgi:hypothetical protein